MGLSKIQLSPLLTLKITCLLKASALLAISFWILVPYGPDR